MTQAPDVAPVAFQDLDEAVAVLRGRGLRLSTARRMVLEVLFDADRPVGAQWIADRLDIELTSVYRNLETLERYGLVRHVHLGHGPGLYLLVGGGEREYLYCERCGEVQPLEPSALDPVRSRIEDLFGYAARFTHFPIVGVCRRCSSPPGDSAVTTRGSSPAAPPRAGGPA